MLMALRNLLSPNTLPSLANPKACDGVTLTNSLVPSRNIRCPVKTNLWWSVISTLKAPHQLRHSGVEAPIVRPDPPLFSSFSVKAPWAIILRLEHF